MIAMYAAPKSSLGGLCTSNDACAADQSACVDGVCSCQSGYYMAGGQCSTYEHTLAN